MRLRWFWTVLFITLTAATRAQNRPMPGSPSDSLAAARLFEYASLPVTHNPNGGERRDVVTAGRLATGEPVHIHESMQPPGLPPAPAHTIRHSEFILVPEGTLEITQDGKTERAGPGSVIYIAYGTTHQARNAGPGPISRRQLVLARLVCSLRPRASLIRSVTAPRPGTCRTTPTRPS